MAPAIRYFTETLLNEASGRSLGLGSAPEKKSCKRPSDVWESGYTLSGLLLVEFSFSKGLLVMKFWYSCNH